MYQCFNGLLIEAVSTIVVFLHLAYAKEPKSPNVVLRLNPCPSLIGKSTRIWAYGIVEHITILPQPLFDCLMHDENLS